MTHKVLAALGSDALAGCWSLFLGKATRTSSRGWMEMPLTSAVDERVHDCGGCKICASRVFRSEPNPERVQVLCLKGFPLRTKPRRGCKFCASRVFRSEPNPKRVQDLCLNSFRSEPNPEEGARSVPQGFSARNQTQRGCKICASRVFRSESNPKIMTCAGPTRKKDG